MQIVAFDEEGKARRSGSPRSPSAYDKFLTARFRLDPARLPPDKVSYVGVEAIRRGNIERLGRAAQRRAEGQGVDLLPLPEIGRPYALSIRVGGKSIDSSQWLGRVVLVDL